MIKINGKPLLSIWIEKLKKLGVKKILINTHYKSKKVKQHIMSSKYKNMITVSYEKRLLGTAGTLIKNLKFFDNKDGYLIHADNYTQDNLRNFKRDHLKKPKNCVFTMLTHKTNVPHMCGIIEKNKQKILIGFYEKQKVKRVMQTVLFIYFLKNLLMKLKKKNIMIFQKRLYLNI